MCALKRPSGRAVVELAVCPVHRVVARRTLRRGEACRYVIRYGAAKRLCAQPCRLMAAIAIGVSCCEGVVVADVAVGALHDFTRRLQLVRTGQRPARSAVVEDGRGPGDGVMAGGAIGHREWRASRRVSWVVRGLPRGQVALGVAAVSGRDRKAVVVIDVAGGAGRYFAAIGHKLVRIRQWKTGGGMVER